ncbi:hypothetical protein [Stenoxybacter acetivorans]|uniref:hypothetical protein n=1 Tax=Stenoxybacter acetivorans TaxID=422441 RepID=UPI000566A886|nr:hypothetical protein [Stenoxybacter acetivorans]
MKSKNLFFRMLFIKVLGGSLILFFTLFIFLAIIANKIYNYNDNNPFDEVKGDDKGIVYQLPFEPKEICVLPPYGDRIFEYEPNKPHHHLVGKVNRFLDFKKFKYNQENQVTLLFLNDEEIFGLTITRNRFYHFNISNFIIYTYNSINISNQISSCYQVENNKTIKDIFNSKSKIFLKPKKW